MDYSVIPCCSASSRTHVWSAFAQLSPESANNGSSHINVEVSGQSNREGNQVQSQAIQCAHLKSPTGNTGTNSTEDETSTTEPG